MSITEALRRINIPKKYRENIVYWAQGGLIDAYKQDGKWCVDEGELLNIKKLFSKKYGI